MTILACGPTPLLNRIRQRLNPSATSELAFATELSADQFKHLQTDDSLIILQPPSSHAARTIADLAANQHIHYIELVTLDSPYAPNFGFMLTVAGTVCDIQTIRQILNELAPSPEAWWHVGHAGAAAFLSHLQSYTLLNPLGQASTLPAPELKISKEIHAECLAFLQETQNERFISCHPERANTLAKFLNRTDSPARQAAHLLSLLPLTA